jgi:hypothetical protein
MSSVDSQTFGRLMIRLEDELSRDSRISILHRLTGKPAVAENNGSTAIEFWAFLHACGAFTREYPDPNIFEGFPVVQKMIREVCFPRIREVCFPQSIVDLEELILQEHIWSNIGERLSDIQIELDNELHQSNKLRSIRWFYVVTSAKGGPKGQTKALFSEAKQQMCLPELIRAISKVSPMTGQFLHQPQFSPITKPSQVPYYIPDAQKQIPVDSQITTNPFVKSMEIQYQTKSMHASTLLSQREDVPLKKHVIRLMLALGENDAWLKFAEAKGATSGADAEKRISDAQATGEPESIVIPLIAQASGYLALTFLSDLKTMINSNHVTHVVDQIEEHLAMVESATQNKGDKVAQVNSSIRQWIIKNELCDITSQSDIQDRVDALKEFEVSSLDDLKILDKEDFEKCGFKGIKAKKAYNASRFCSNVPTIAPANPESDLLTPDFGNPDSVEPDSVKVTKTVAMEDEDLYSLSTYDVPGKHLNPFKK